MKVKVLTFCDLHQWRSHYDVMQKAVALHQPDAVIFGGDFLGLQNCPKIDIVPVKEAAEIIGSLPVPHVILVRGNWEDGDNITEFRAAWPKDKPFVALNGDTYQVGPLLVTGFPCREGDEYYWLKELKFKKKPRNGRWLTHLMQETGIAGRTLWIMHQPPVGETIGMERDSEYEWTQAVDRHQPIITVSGHAHRSPIVNQKWFTKRGETYCVNAGQDWWNPHYALIEFEFPSDQPSLPSSVSVTAIPWNQKLNINSIK